MSFNVFPGNLQLCLVFCILLVALYFEVVQSLVEFRTLFTVIVVEISKGIDTKAKYDGQRACEIFIYIGSVRNNNMVFGDYSAKKDRQLSHNTY